VEVNGHFAQVTDFAAGNGYIPYSYAWLQMMDTYNLGVRWDMNPKNWRGGQLVDFQHWWFGDKQAYVERLKRLAHDYAAWGSRDDPYQGIVELGFTGQRRLEHRTAQMGLDSIDFRGKAVLDIGCNLGAFCMDAVDRGARYVVGIDLPRVADIAFEVTNYLGYWCVDCIGAHLPREKDKIPGGFDIVYALSCKQTQPIPWVFDLVDDIMFVEGHVGENEDTYRRGLETAFSTVKTLASTMDHGPRPLFKCSRGNK
jgi:SAM-dependent methyltransferase